MPIDRIHGLWALLLALMPFAAAPPAFAAPANDNKASPASLTLNTRARVNTTTATVEPGELEHIPGSKPYRTVWYRWTNGASAKQTVVDLETTDFESFVAVYQGSVTAQTKVRWLNAWGFSEHAQFLAQPNATYYLVVGGLAEDAEDPSFPASGPAAVRVTQSAPENDAYARARVVDLDRDVWASEWRYGFSANLRLATRSSDEPENSWKKTVWFTMTAPSTGRLVVKTCGSGIDTVVGVYTGDTAAAATEVGGSDDAPRGGCGTEPSTDSYGGVQVVAGTQYRIGVGLYEEAESEGEPIYLQLEYDNDAPKTDLSPDIGPPRVTRDDKATLHFSSAAPDLAYYECSLDGAAFATCQAPSVLEGLGEGRHIFAVRAVDAAGNQGEAVTREWVVDRTGPQLKLTGAPSGTVTETSADITWEVEPDAQVTCSLDGAAAAACSSPLRLTGLAPGPHELTLTATDAVGNPGAPATARWTVEPPPPPPPPPAVTRTKLKTVQASMRHLWRLDGLGVRVVKLRVRDVPARGSVTVACTKRDCGFRRRTVKNKGKEVSLRELLAKRALRPGARLTIAITAPGMIGKVFTITIRRAQSPAVVRKCLPPGAARPARCGARR